MRRVAVPVTIALAILAPAARAQQTGWRDRVQERLRRAAETITGRGYAETGTPRIGSLSDDDNEWFTLTLHAGTAYALVGVCDNDCSDLDLVLYDADDKQIDSDVENDDVPIVQVAPTETMRYRVKVIMASCRTNPCWYGIGVYGK